jgi:hypothetical protein
MACAANVDDGDLTENRRVWLKSANRADRRRSARKSCGASSATANKITELA